MKKKISRRDLFKFVGGSAAGLMLTPMPWKLLDDSAIWTQNWSWVPEPLKGTLQTKYTTCTLCPAGCGLRARCVGNQPVSLSGVAGHPVSSGVVCPVALGAHHLPYHPARVLQPFKRTESGSSPISLDEAAAAIAGLISSIRTSGSTESIAVLDGQPNRTMSAIYRRFLSQVPNGKYIVPPSISSRSFSALDDMLEKPSGEFGYDLENVKTVVSFGAPILDGWGTPGRVQSAFGKQAKGSGKGFQLIQIETRRSRTASLADSWIPINPGTEAVFALGLANVVISGKLCDGQTVANSASDYREYQKLVSRFTPDVVARITGVNSDKIVQLARTMAKQRPTLVIGGGDPGAGPMGREEELAFWGLNFLLGSVGSTGGALARREINDARSTDPKQVEKLQFEDVPDNSIRLLVIDDAESGCAIPASFISKKLVSDGAIVVSLSPYLTGYSSRADYIIPSPTFLESLRDVVTPSGATCASLSLSLPLLTPPNGASEPVEFIQKVASLLNISLGDYAVGKTLESYIRRRVEAIHKSKRGNVFVSSDKKFVEVKSISSPEELWKMLASGGCWIDEKSAAKTSLKFSFLGKDSPAGKRLRDWSETMIAGEQESTPVNPLVLMPFGWLAASGSGQVSPIMSKVYQESNLRHTSRQAFVNPVTAKSYRLADGKPMLIETSTGSMRAETHVSASVMPGVIHIEVGPDSRATGNGQTRGTDVLSVCSIKENSTWRITHAKVREA